MSKRSWIDVDLDGLEQTLTRRAGLVWILHELLSNVFDTAATMCTVTLEAIPGVPHVRLHVMDDDPDGFHDLTHAWTLYAPSERKVDASKRGRWNAGCKLVLARCKWAQIMSTTGCVVFDVSGRRRTGARTERGSEFEAIVRMTREELDEVLQAVKLIIPPIPTTINGESLQSRCPIETFEASLPTEIADQEGYLRPTTRTTTVHVYESKGSGRIYELGIPVVETGDPWDIEVCQKVPLNSDRDNVTPSYLRTLRVSVVNRMHSRLTPETAASPAVQEALGDKRIEPAAVESIVTQQYGDKRAIFDPSDPQANNQLVAEGWAIIHGGAYTRDQHEQIRRAEAALPSGRIRPTPHPYSPDGETADFIPEEEWTDGMCNIAAYANAVAYRMINRSIVVRFERGRRTDSWGANYGIGVLTFNYERLGKSYFESGVSERINALLIHELAHEMEGNHLSESFYKALQSLGAKLTELALREPELFRKHGWRAS